jgi:hypothetical protein
MNKELKICRYKKTIRKEDEKNNMGRTKGALNQKTIEKLKKEGKPVPAQPAKKVKAVAKEVPAEPVVETEPKE